MTGGFKCRLRRWSTRLLVIGLLLCVLVLFIFPRWPTDDNQNTMFNIPLDNEEINNLLLKRIEKERADIGGRPRTLEALLESILLRLGRLEAVVFGGSANNSLSLSDQLSNDAQKAYNERACELPSSWQSTHPNCQKKIDWMTTFWRSDPCYGVHGVDGSRCSIILYLSEKESHCPVLDWRLSVVKEAATTQSIPQIIQTATRKTDLNELLELMTDNPTNYNWIKSRVSRMWPKWQSAMDVVVAKQNWTMQNRPRLRILMHMGFLTKESGFKFGEKSASGGPLGELVQWSDLIASLFILGHQLTISTEIKTFTSFAQADPALKSSCQIEHENKYVDLIYTDIVGLRQMKRKIPGSLLNYKCRLRVLDSFGTHAEFNDPIYFTKHKQSLGGKPKNVWGGHRLNLRQFFTMFPHTPDNSFLGFVVETYTSNLTVTEAVDRRRNLSLVYGKEAYMWKDATSYLKEVQKQTEMHATVNTDKPILSGVVNHGVLGGEQFHQLLGRIKVFIGLGFPYEGPAPLEAIANGAVFLNPKFVPPKGRRTEKFFAEKPTLRALTSQNPYMEEFIGPPYVLTFDISNHTAIREAVTIALTTTTVPYLPYEFTAPGMLERVNAFLMHQDWCSASSNWPPFSAAQIVFAPVGQSCLTACAAQGAVCERTFFSQINRLEVMKGHGSCVTSEEVSDAQAPAISASHCLLQNNELIFSCATEPSSEVRRLCPCRDFVRDQIALCAACL